MLLRLVDYFKHRKDELLADLPSFEATKLFFKFRESFGSSADSVVEHVFGISDSKS